MSILGNFPAAPAKELPEGVVGYLHYNRGEKLPLTKVEVLPDAVALLKTIAGSSKPLCISVGGTTFEIVTEDGYYRQIDYEGNVKSSTYLGYPLTAMSTSSSPAYSVCAYTSGSTHYVRGMSGVGKWKWSHTQHTAKVISCSGNYYDALSVDANGTVVYMDEVYANSAYSYVLKWNVTVKGCTLVYSNFCVVVGSVLKLLSPFDGSVLAEVDTGHNIIGIDANYVYCDDGYVIEYTCSKQSISTDGQVTGYTGTVSVQSERDFGKNVNRIVSANAGYFVLYADGEIAKVDSDFNVTKWSYTANVSGALFGGSYGYVAGPNVVVAREDGNVEILRQELCRVKVYFNEEAV